MNSKLALDMRQISKEFSGVKALKNVSFDAKQGEIHALVGENGAGKSTLMKILSGLYPNGSFSGEIQVGGKPQFFQSTKDSEKAGIAIIYQELALVKQLSIAENIFLGHEVTSRKWIIDWDETHRRARDLLNQVGLNASPATKVESLGVGEQQLVEIAKALGKNAQILILDEPTAALTETESIRLLNILRQLKSRGITCLYISHRLHEVISIADRVTILRDGQTIETITNQNLDEQTLVRLMVGRELTERYPHRPRTFGATALAVQNWTVAGPRYGSIACRDISLAVKQGEILGISGLMGAGRSEFVMSLFGVYGKRLKGSLQIEGQDAQINSAASAIDAGLALVSEDRKRFGLILDMDIGKNTTLASLPAFARWGVLNPNREIQESLRLKNELKTKTPNLEQKARNLSGGNQQKVVLAKWLLTKPKILLLDEPTRGIDVGAKYEIYSIMLELASRGVAIIMVSSDLAEILGMSDRIIVMRDGQVSGELSREEASQERIMTLATAPTTHSHP